MPNILDEPHLDLDARAAIEANRAVMEDPRYKPNAELGNADHRGTLVIA